MKEQFMKVKDVVEEVLAEDKRARNNDKWLIIQVLRRMGFKIYIDYRQLDDMPAFESITRCRRKFQEQGLYLPDEKVREGRREAEEEMRNINKWFGGE